MRRRDLITLLGGDGRVFEKTWPPGRQARDFFSNGWRCQRVAAVVTVAKMASHQSHCEHKESKRRREAIFPPPGTLGLQLHRMPPAGLAFASVVPPLLPRIPTSGRHRPDQSDLCSGACRKRCNEDAPISSARPFKSNMRAASLANMRAQCIRVARAARPRTRRSRTRRVGASLSRPPPSRQWKVAPEIFMADSIPS